MNSEGGNLWFGIRDDGVVTGLILSKADRNKILSGVKDIMKCYTPSVEEYLVNSVFIPVIGEGSCYVFVVQVAKGVAPIYLIDEKECIAYYKIDGSVFPMSLDLIARRISKADEAVATASQQGLLGERQMLIKRCTDFISNAFENWTENYPEEKEKVAKENNESTTAGETQQPQRPPPHPNSRILVLHGLPQTGKKSIALNIMQRLALNYTIEVLIMLNDQNFEITGTTLMTACINSVEPRSLKRNDETLLKEAFYSVFKGKKALVFIESNNPYGALRDALPPCPIILSTCYANIPRLQKLCTYFVERVNPVPENVASAIANSICPKPQHNVLNMCHGFVGAISHAFRTKAVCEKYIPLSIGLERLLLGRVYDMVTNFPPDILDALSLACTMPPLFPLEGLMGILKSGECDKSWLYDRLWSYALVIQVGEGRICCVPEGVRQMFKSSRDYRIRKEVSEEKLMKYVGDLISAIIQCKEQCTKSTQIIIKDIPTTIFDHIHYDIPINAKKLQSRNLLKLLEKVCLSEVKLTMQAIRIAISRSNCKICIEKYGYQNIKDVFEGFINGKETLLLLRALSKE